MRFPRSSGVLCHVTSLPSPHGIGDLGATSRRWVDFLTRAGQRYWQILPLVPPSEGDSPYSGYSALAGNPLLISLDELVHEGILDASQIAPPDDLAAHPESVDYRAVGRFKRSRLRDAFDQFLRGDHPDLRRAHDHYVDHTDWLDDFARFEALMIHFDQPDWSKWPAELVRRTPATLAHWDSELADEMAFSRFQQFLFDRQWNRLKAYANERGVAMYGDMPIFVAHQSADVWAHQSLFALHPDGRPELVAGVPPDYFSKTGQLWGNPQYRWDVLRQTGYAWWTRRFQAALQQFDLLRVDHFRGFEAYWEVPASAKTAVSGRWVPGPGAEPFRAAAESLGELPMIAEDLGMITEAVHRLRDELGFPGMRVFQFGFDNAEDDFHRPSTYHAESVAYTGTHDNDTLMGWYGNRKPADPANDPLHDVITSESEVHWQMIHSVLRSASDIAIVPIQDYLGLDNSARMNVPGKAKGNWAWRLSQDAIDDQLADQMRRLAEACGRIPE